MRGGSSALGHCLLALLQVLPSPWNTWSQDSRRNTAQSFLSAAQTKKKNSFLTKKNASLSEEVMQRLKSITVVEWTQQKQIADTKANTGNVWLHSKLVGFLFLRSACDSIIFYAFLCVSYLLPSIFYTLFQNRKTYSIFWIFFYHSFTLPWNFQALPPLSFYFTCLVSWKIFSSLPLTGHVQFLHPITNSMQQIRRASQPRYLQW